MTDECLNGIMNRDNSDKKNDNVPHPICPINMYFEGDEDECDSSKCDFDIETRMCSQGCVKMKPQPKKNESTKNKWIVMQQNLGLGHYGKILITTQKRVNTNQEPIAKDINNSTYAHQIVQCVNERDTLVNRCGEIGVERDVAIGELAEIRPYADCYKRVCESLGIEKDILGYVKNLTDLRDSLRIACKIGLDALKGISRITTELETKNKTFTKTNKENHENNIRIVENAIANAKPKGEQK